MKLWAFDDVHGWGKALCAAATARGIDCRLFEDISEPDEGALFMYMHNHPAVRAHDKRFMMHFATMPGLLTIPDYRASVLYDDRLEQQRQFAKWMPRTTVLRSPRFAREYLDDHPALPIVSKSAEGSGSVNMRVLKTLDEARTEIKRAFSDLGIRLRHNQRQHGYLMWQEYIEDASDFRVIVIGQERVVLRKATERSAQHEVATKGADADEALVFADKFAKEQRIAFGAIDLLRDSTGRWYVTEYTCAWSFGDDDRLWNTLLDQLEAGNLS